MDGSSLLYELEDYERITGKPWKPIFFSVKPSDGPRKFSSAIKAAVWDKTDGHCFHCGIILNPWRNFSVDHLLPIAKGGTDDLVNLVPACRTCNAEKGSR